ncbi:hypothetical protein [Jeotgalibaca caeni]|uniref:YobI family P-loop NTPase n=1 Tax=Jeotgalibaca caeni TaxID=3028623 RepID=UPI00237E48CF|nr:hypothetical protein [Jeotgalibaca caeni]
MEKNKVYLDALKEALSFPENRNIAIIGNYGSGKTSIIQTFIKKNDTYTYLNLSLAAFVETEGNLGPTDESVDADKWERLENSLVKQMIYRQKKSKMPYSSFRRISSISNRTFLWHTIMLGIFLASWFLMNQYDEFSHELLESLTGINEPRWLLLVPLGVSGTYSLYFILRLLASTFKLSKLSFSSFSVEPSPNDNSYFSKYLDEILYFFETSGVNVVFIEDIDRFNSLEVFEHLRELNYLINNSQQIKGPVKFVYAIKDSIFETKKRDKAAKESQEYIRTKFFDFILPIIPVIDSNNSREFLVPQMEKILREELEERRKLEKEREKQEKIGEANEKNSDSEQLAKEAEMKRFLIDISIYLDDLRLIKNICNEFRVYKANLRDVNNLDDKKLFAIIVYKNIMPTDFAELQSNKGILHGIFHEEKNELLSKLNEDLKQEKAELERRLSSYDADNKLKAEMAISGLIVKTVPTSYFSKGYVKEAANGNTGPLKLFPIDNIVIQDFTNPTNTIKYYNGQTWVQFKREDIQKYLQMAGVKENSSFESTHGDEEGRIIKDLQQVNSQLAHLWTEPVKSLLSSNEEFREKITVKVPDYALFLLYLIGEGYIDEQYGNYISNVYENTLSRNDSAIIRKLRAGSNLKDDETLENFPLSIHELSENDFYKTAILHKNILVGLFKDVLLDEAEVTSKRKLMVETFQDRLRSRDKVLFLETLFPETYEDTALFFKMIVEKNQTLFSELSPYFPNAVSKNEFIFRIFFSCDIDLLKSCMKKDSYVTSQIEKIPGFINALREKQMRSVESLQEIFMDNPVKFRNAGIREMSQEDADYILENSMYEINKENAIGIFRKYSGLDEDIFSISALLNLDIPGLSRNINESFEKFVSILSDIDELHEDNALMVKIMNHVNIDESLKMHVLKNNIEPVSDVSEITDKELQRLIFENGNFDASLDNFITSTNHGVEYTTPCLLDEIVVQRLTNELTHIDITDDKKTAAHAYMQKVVSNKAFEVQPINLSFFSKYTDYSVASMSSKTFEILLDNKCIPVTLANINLLSNEQKMHLIHQDEPEAFRLKESISFSDEEIIIGLELFEEDMLRVVIDKSFVAEKFSIEESLQVEWIKQVIESQILLSAKQIAIIYRQESVSDKDVLLSLMIHVIKEKILPATEIENYLPYIDATLSAIHYGAYGTKKLNVKFYQLLKELEKIERVTSISKSNGHVRFSNKRK